MSKFRAGERVALYTDGKRVIAVVEQAFPGSTYKVWFDEKKSEHISQYVHERQCRRLMKKKLREIWCMQMPSGNYYGIYESKEEASFSGNEIVHFREVIEKKNKGEK